MTLSFSKTTIIATVSSAANSFSETLSTLKFARRAKEIKNQAVINQESTDAVNELQAELVRLRSELRMLKESRLGTSSTPSPAPDRIRHIDPRNIGKSILGGGAPANQEQLRELEDLLCKAMERADLLEENNRRLLDDAAAAQRKAEEDKANLQVELEKVTTVVKQLEAKAKEEEEGGYNSDEEVSFRPALLKRAPAAAPAPGGAKHGGMGMNVVDASQLVAANAVCYCHCLSAERLAQMASFSGVACGGSSCRGTA